MSGPNFAKFGGLLVNMAAVAAIEVEGPGLASIWWADCRNDVTDHTGEVAESLIDFVESFPDEGKRKAPDRPPVEAEGMVAVPRG